MENTGIIADPRSPEQKALDYIAGAETPISSTRHITSWLDYLPQGERQSTDTFDTMSCVSFSAGHIIEAQIIWLLKNNKVPDFIVKDLKEKGYFTNTADLGSFRVSKRHIAIISGTTKQGNYFHKVWDTIRKQGVIPHTDLPFGGNTWEEYMGAEITDNMKSKGISFLNHFTVSYQWLNFDGQAGFSPIETSVVNEALQSSPLHIGIPISASHAIMQYSLNKPKYGVLDHYVPFIRENDELEKPVNFAIQSLVDVKVIPPQPTKPKWTFKNNISFGMKNSDVKALQQVLIYEGFMKVGLDTGYFGNITKSAVVKWQEKHADKILKPVSLNQGTGYIGKQSLAYLNSVYS